jgi:hypothetical protein
MILILYLYNDFFVLFVNFFYCNLVYYDLLSFSFDWLLVGYLVLIIIYYFIYLKVSGSGFILLDAQQQQQGPLPPPPKPSMIPHLHHVVSILRSQFVSPAASSHASHVSSPFVLHVRRENQPQSDFGKSTETQLGLFPFLFLTAQVCNCIKDTGPWPVRYLRHLLLQRTNTISLDKNFFIRVYH